MIYLATDHAGFELKEKIKKYLQDSGHEVQDFGALEMNPDDDYPDFISKAAGALSTDPESFAIVLGGSGQGEMMVANKFKNVRCALFYAPTKTSEDPYEMIRTTREHNNSNCLSLGARFLSDEEAIEAVKIFLGSPFSKGERHVRRIEKISEIEKHP